MKAFLLAAGKGTRLLPLTLTTPKCLVPISKKPLIEYWFDLFRLHGINEILINTSHLAEQVETYIANSSGGLDIKLTYEENLLGSGGTFKKNWYFVNGDSFFFICYADNLTNINLKRMLEFHNKHKKDFTLALLRVPNPTECGIVELDEYSSLVSFNEKPENPVSDLAFAGIMLSSQNLKNFFPGRDCFDLGYDVLPRIIGNASGYIMNEYLLDIGTYEKLKQAEEDIKNGVFSSGKRAF
ncbi:MAG: Nucleotidyl transferase [Nitrospirae bacterium]|nr:Nucleotidyl transferase [Nitrospirota bacterium]